MATRKSPRVTSRHLTITSTLYDTKRRTPWFPPLAVPFLRLRGYWLLKAGFEAGKRVQVQVSDCRIVIVPVED